jgi:hypothetical protein
MAIEYQEVVVLRNEALSSVTRTVQPGHVIEYERKGGGETSHPWRVAGFFSEPVGASRLVFEALHFESDEVCLLRVYAERPLQIAFSVVLRKRARDEHLVAATASISLIGGRELSDVASERGEMREALPEVVRTALFPIPPPIAPGTLELSRAR